MKEQLSTILASTLCGDSLQLKQAENALNQLKSKEGFILALLEFCVSNEPDDRRLAAVLALKNLLVDKWNVTFKIDCRPEAKKRLSPRVVFENNVFYQIASDGKSRYEILSVDGTWIAGVDQMRQNPQMFLQQFNQPVHLFCVNDSIISGQDRLAFRSALFPAVVQSIPKVREQLLRIFTWVVREDFPDNYSSLIPSIEEVLTTSKDLGCLRNCACIVRAFLRVHQYAAAPKLKLILPFFPKIYPGMLNLLKACVTNVSSPQPHPDSWYIIKMIVRSFLSAHVLKIYPYFMQRDVMADWLQTLLSILQKGLPMNEIDPSNTDKIHQACKVRKWIVDIAYRFLSYYGRPDQVKKDENELIAFAAWWSENFKKTFLEACFSILKSYAEGGFVYKKTTMKVYGFLILCVDESQLFSLIRPELNFLIGSCCLKSITLNQEELELWKNDPLEFAALLDDEMASVRSTATKLIRRLVFVRTRFVLQSILDFISKTLSSKETDDESMLGKEAGMQIFQSLESVFTARENEALKQSAHQLLLSTIIPFMEDNSPVIRARACSTVGTYYTFKYDDKMTINILKCLLMNIGDGNLVVRVEAAGALSQLMLNNRFLDALKKLFIHKQPKMESKL